MSLGNWQVPFVKLLFVSAIMYNLPAGIIERVSEVTATSAGSIRLFRPAAVSATWMISIIGICRGK